MVRITTRQATSNLYIKLQVLDDDVRAQNGMLGLTPGQHIPSFVLLMHRLLGPCNKIIGFSGYHMMALQWLEPEHACNAKHRRCLAEMCFASHLIATTSAISVPKLLMQA